MSAADKKWTIGFFIVFLTMLLGAGAATAVIDPYFHYHKPLKGLSYPLNNQRYQNNGIVKHFDYDAIITGTSMTENFKATEFDRIFQVNSIKIPFSGGSYKEMNDNLEIALAHNDGIKIILRGLDYNSFLSPADSMRYEEDFYPWYLYDDNPFNDVKYVFNKTILFGATKNVISRTRSGLPSTTFDEYSNWMANYTFGKEAVDGTYTRAEKADGITPISQEDYKNIRENITQNVTELAAAHPEIEFYLFFTPYSIYDWDSLNQAGTLKRQLAGEKYAIELMLPYDNIHLFSFFTEHDMICDLDNYKDIAHYGENINSRILRWMKAGEHELTEENYEAYCEEMKDFYMNYDYDRLFESCG